MASTKELRKCFRVTFFFFFWWPGKEELRKTSIRLVVTTQFLIFLYEKMALAGASNRENFKGCTMYISSVGATFWFICVISVYNNKKKTTTKVTIGCCHFESVVQLFCHVAGCGSCGVLWVVGQSSSACFISNFVDVS